MSGDKIPVGISACLLGHKVRFDSGHKRNDYIERTLGEYFEFTSFCPEVDIGLGTPRETIRLVSQTFIANAKDFDKHQVQCVGTKTKELDVTDQLKACAQEQSHWHKGMCGYILKKDSPSCGMERVKVYINDNPQKVGIGMYAQTLMKNFPDLPVEEEGRLGDARLRENFIKRVFIYHRWVNLNPKGLTWKNLYEFHGQHKLILLSHNQNLARDLGRDLSNAAQKNIEEFKKEYFSRLMQLLKIIATPKNHVNVLQHLQGYLKTHISKEDKKELCDTIEQYGAGLLPLIVPITMFRHYFRQFPHDYVTNSYYLAAHPKELMLLNTV